MALDSSSVALIGIGVAFGISVLTAIVFLILYARLKIKDDTNIRRRVIATTPIEAEKALILSREPELVEEFIEPIPVPLHPPPPPPTVVYPAPVPIPAPPRPSTPPPQQIFIVQPTPQPPPPQPLPPPPPREPEVVVHEVIHRYEPAPPAPAPPPQERVVRRRSWGGPQEPEDDWVLVKKITKSSGKKATKVIEDSTDESSDEEVETKVKRRHKKRLDRYDLATNVIPIGFRPPSQMMASAGFMMAQPTTMMAQPTTMMAQPMMAQPMMAATQPTYMPFFTVPR